MVVALVAAAASLPLAEVGLRLLGGYSPRAARERAEQLVDAVGGVDAERPAAQGPRAPQSRSLNPYYGYDLTNGFELMERYVQLHRSPERDQHFTILFCGGSVPEIFVGIRQGGADLLIELLKADPRLVDKRITICRLARAGYKQPQQLGKLAYFFARGCSPDVVVNIDGLNDTKLGTRNLLYGLHPTWPSAGHWLHLTDGPAGEPAAWEAYVAARSSQAEFLSYARESLAGASFRTALLGRLRQRGLETRYERWLADQEAYVSLLNERNAVRDPTAEDREAALSACVETWRECSEMMATLCRERGALYLHLLQPTLHDRGSKIVTPQEHAKGIGEKGMDPLVKESYDRLRASGEELVRRGVAFVDTSHVFADVDETLYHDVSHFNKKGNRILAERIAAEILARL